MGSIKNEIFSLTILHSEGRDHIKSGNIDPPLANHEDDTIFELYQADKEMLGEFLTAFDTYYNSMF